MTTRSTPRLRSSGLSVFWWTAWWWTILAVLPMACATETPLRLMAVGDSITEGGKAFVSYRPLLAAKLAAAGYSVRFVGSRTSESPLGPLRHEGYGGKNVEYLADNVPAHFAQTPADIVLLHAGHNHAVEEHPVPGMIAATERLILALRAVNPHVVVLLAQVIPSGKLPKYSYLPELNAELARLAPKLSTPASPIILVDQASRFDWQADTIVDHVHPNASGAGKIADRWFVAITKLIASSLPPSATAKP
jgi:lysophospholipase L1-like esterase